MIEDFETTREPRLLQLGDEDILEKINEGLISGNDAVLLGADLIISANFNIGSVAFSDRVINHDSYSLKKDFQKIAPLEEEIGIDEINDFLLEDWDDE